MSGFAPVSNWHAPLRRFCRPQTTSNAIVFASRKHGPTHPTRTTPLGGVEAGGSHGLQRRGRAAIEAREAKATATGGTDPHGAFLSRLLRHAARHDCAADHNPFFRQALSPTCQACQTEVGPQVKCPKQHLNICGNAWRRKQDGSARGPFRLGSQRRRVGPGDRSPGPLTEPDLWFAHPALWNDYSDSPKSNFWV